MNDKLLRNALRVNAAFSLLVAVDLLLFISLAVQVLGNVNPLYLQVLGWGLVVFGVELLIISSAATINLKFARVITVMDWSWVAGSVVLLLLAGEYFSMTGTIIVQVVAVIVGLCAYFQGKGIDSIRMASPA